MCLCLFRLVPNLVALILFCTFILPWIGTGPLWNQVVRHHSDICKTTWWRNLLFIHNYFGFETMVSLTVIQTYEIILSGLTVAYYTTHFLVSGFFLSFNIFNKAQCLGHWIHFPPDNEKKVNFLNCCVLFEIQ